jgi:mono/diheme cytochrome c family protein
MHFHRIGIAIVLLVAPTAFAQNDDDDEQPPGLRARYQSGAAIVERVDPDVAFVWGDAAPDERLPAGTFTARWDGSLLLRIQDTYRFHAFMQGRVVWKVGGQIVLEGEADQPRWISGPEIALSFGDQPFELSFARTGDAAQIKLYWSSTEFPLEPVPYHALFQTKPSPELTLVERGRIQFDAFRCANCHGGARDEEHATRDERRFPAPSLNHVGVGTKQEWLVDKLMHEPVPGAGRMPHFRFRRDEAAAIVAALLAKAAPVDLTATPKPKESERAKDIQAGGTLVRSVGCLACHTWNSLGEATPFGGGSLDDVANHRSAEWLTTWLTDPARLNPAHRMPVFTLTEKERSQIVLALQSPLAPALRGEWTEKDDSERIARGRKLIESSRCAACHELPGTQPDVAAVNSLTRADVNWTKGCTDASQPVAHQPRFPQVDVKAMRAYVTSWQGREPTVPALDSDRLTRDSRAGRRVLERKNCLGCHDRDDVRGISKHAAAMAQADASLNGLHMTLIPPRLNAVGDRMQDEALATAIQGEQKSRRLDWLRVRMPKFPHTPVEQAALVAHLIGHDRIPERPTEKPLTHSPDHRNGGARRGGRTTRDSDSKPDPQRLLAGRELLGGKGFSCVACHAVKDYTPKVTALGTRGSNLFLIGQRMRTDYFFRWTRAPLRVMPGVEMPNYQRPHEFILPGKLDEQLTAIWEALNDPNLTAPTNPAVVEQLLTVNNGERPRIVRDVFTVPGGKEGETVARSFAIGLDNGHSMLFDLDTGSLRGWTLGDFARQRCEGKRWYWDLEGTVLAAKFDPRPEILFVDSTTGEVASPETGWQYELRLLSQFNDGFHCQLHLSKGEATHEAKVTVIVSTTKDSAGWERRITVFNPKGSTLVPWHRGAKPEVLHETASLHPRIIRTAGAKDPPAPLPANARPFAAEDVDSKHPLYDRYAMTLGYHSSLHRVEAASPNPAAPPLVSAPDRITSVPGFRGERLLLPRSIMPTAMTFDDQSRMIFTSLKGHVFRVEAGDSHPLRNASSTAPGSVSPRTSKRDDEIRGLTTLADGLAAPFGVLWNGRETAGEFQGRDCLIVSHKPELLVLYLPEKSNELYKRRVLATGWGLTDDYHDWTCGIARDSTGNLFIGLASDYTFKNRPKEKSKWRGDILRIDPAGTIESIARGLRYPTGLAVDDRDRLFVTDQQGVQNTFNELNCIQSGHRYGVPSRHEPEPDAPADPPAVQIPHPWTRSVNGIVFVAGKSRVPSVESREPEKKPGSTTHSSAALDSRPSPLDSIAEQFLGCEYNNNMLVRMSVQDVDGVVQGAVYPFSKPMAESAPLSADAAKRPMPQDASSFIGPICLAISPAGEIYVGGFQDGGWAGGLNMGDIVKLTPDGALPNGIREIRATPSGFDIGFFHPVDPKRAAQTSQYKISGYTRVWKGDYATPDSGHHTGEVKSAELGDDGRRVSLVVGGLKPGHVYDVSVGEIGTGDKRNLWPAMGHYTLHRIPR